MRAGYWSNKLVKSGQEQVHKETPSNIQSCETRGALETSITKGISAEMDLKGGAVVQARKGQAEEKKAVGGLKDVGDIMSRLRTVREFGKKLRTKLDDWLDQLPGIEEECEKLIGVAEEEMG